MYHKNITIEGKTVEGYVIPLEGVNLVFAIVTGGMIGCGAFDVTALDKFGYAAARIGSKDGSPISTIDDLLDGVVNAANETAAKKGIKEGLSGKDALNLF